LTLPGSLFRRPAARRTATIDRLHARAGVLYRFDDPADAA
jgi:hypothetical protein